MSKRNNNKNTDAPVELDVVPDTIRDAVQKENASKVKTITLPGSQAKIVSDAVAAITKAREQYQIVLATIFAGHGIGSANVVSVEGDKLHYTE